MSLRRDIPGGRADPGRLGGRPESGVAALVETAGPAETEALGARLAQSLVAGDVVLVSGDLGAGKTTFVRGAARALGVTVPVTSPTFTIGQRYPAPVPVSHLDLFRVDALDEEEPELLADYVSQATITFVEWPRDGLSEIAGLGRIARRVRIEHAGEDRRMVEIS